MSIHKGIVAVSSRSRHTSSQELWRVLFYAEDCPLLTHITLNRPELLLGISLYRDISAWDSLQFFLYRNQTAALFSENLIGLAWGDTWKDKEDWGMAVVICIAVVVRNPRENQASTVLNAVHSHRMGKAVAWKRKLKETKWEGKQVWRHEIQCPGAYTQWLDKEQKIPVLSTYFWQSCFK